MAKVGIDLDGVCYDFGAAFRAYLVHIGLRSREQCPEPRRWEFYKDWGFTTGEFLRLCHHGVDAGVIFTYGRPHPGTAAAFQRIKDAGHTIHIVTDRSFGSFGASEAATRSWLDLHELPFDSLTFAADKTIAALDHMVDDKLENYDALAAAGVDVWLLDRPWNQDGATHRKRVHSLLEYTEKLP